MEHEGMPPEPAKESSGLAEQAVEVPDALKPANHYPDAVAVRSEPVADEGSANGIYFKRHRGIIALLVLFVMMVAVAFVLYPRRPAVYRPQSYTVTITTSTELTHALIDVEKLSSNEFGLDITLAADEPFRTKVVVAILQLQLPASSVTAASCQPPDCSSKVASNGPYIGQNDYILDYVKNFKPLPDTLEWGWSHNFVVAASLFAFDENGLDVEGQLPEVQVMSLFNLHPVGNPNIDIGYVMHDRAYEWNGGPSPSGVLSQPSREGWQVDWSMTPKQLSNAVPVSGTDSGSAADDSFRTFVSGALLGVAGGALVGAIQEATHSRRRAKISTGQAKPADTSPAKSN